MKIYMIRHGETPLNSKGCLQGQINTQLNESGVSLAIETGKALKDVKFDLAISSHLDRARMTGQLVLDQNEVSGEIPYEIDERIAEINWGEWDAMGCSTENYELPITQEQFNTFYTDTMNWPGAPGGESIKAICKRTGEFLEELIHREDLQDKTILLATHGCAVRGLLHSLYENQDDFWQGAVPANCAVNIVEVENGVARLVERDKIYYDSSLVNNLYSMVKK